jgi:DNA-binding transcriptional regulator YiaG
MAPAGLADVFGIDMAEAGDTLGSAAGDNGAPSSQGRVHLAEHPNPGNAKGTSVKAAKAAKDAVKGALPVPSPEAPPFPKRLTGKVILSWRGTLGETQLQFASRIGVSAACISQWEKKLCQALQVRERALEALQKAWKETH